MSKVSREATRKCRRHLCEWRRGTVSSTRMAQGNCKFYVNGAGEL